VDETKGELSKAAFDPIHSRYLNSRWTQQTYYRFNLQAVRTLANSRPANNMPKVLEPQGKSPVRSHRTKVTLSA